jgi:hypothetical protein
MISTQTLTYYRRPLACMAFFLLFAMVVCAVRYKSGRHYLPFCLELSTALDAKVVVLSPHGSIRELNRQDKQQSIYFFPDYNSSPAIAIAIASASPQTLPPSITVTLGESYIGLSRSVKLHRTNEQPSDIKAQLPPDAVIYNNPSKYSFHPNLPSKCFNWAGDESFLLTVLVQAIFLTTTIFVMAMAYHHIRKVSLDSNSEWRLIKLATISIPASLAPLYATHHLYATVMDFLTVANPVEAIFSTLIATLALTIFLIPLNVTSNIRITNTGIFLLTTSTLLLLLAIRILLSGASPSYQSGDYGTYLRLGELILDGKWSSLNNNFYLDRIYAERALLFGTPVAFASNFLLSAPHIINFSLVAIISIVLFRLVSRDYGNLAASITTVSFNCHPDILFGGHLCRHDNPSLLYLTLILLSLSIIGKQIWSFQTQSPRTLLGVTILIVFTGFLIGIIEIQRSYLPFLIVTSAIFLSNPFNFATLSLSNRSSISPILLRVTVACLITVCMSLIGNFVASGIRNYLSFRSGPFTIRSLADSLSAMQTQKPGDWQSIHGWLANYPPAIPTGNKSEFTRRKLLYEKFSQYNQMPSHLIQKVQSLVGLRSAIRMSGAQQQYEQFPYVFFVPFASAKFAFGFAATIVLLSLSIIRFTSFSRIPPKPFESTFLTFSLVFIVVVILLAESAEQYDLFLAIPFSINAGIILSHLIRPQVDIPLLQKSPSCSPCFYEAQCLLLGFTILTTIGGIYYAVASYISNQPRLTFARTNGETTSTGPARYENQSNRFSLCFSSDEITSGTVITATTKLNKGDFSKDNARFFISLDQRHQNHTWNSALFLQKNIEYKIKINNKTIYQGLLDSLETPFFAITPIPIEDDFNITLELRSNTDVVSPPSAPPTVAIEYMH